MATFEGTPAECVCWLETGYFSTQRRIVEGAMSTCTDETERARFAEMLDALDRAAYRVTVEPLGMVARDRVRPEWSALVSRHELKEELFNLIANGRREDDDSSVQG